MLKRAPIFVDTSDEKVLTYLMDKIKSTPLSGKSISIDTSTLIDSLCKDVPIPYIAITADAYMKMMALVGGNATEIAWHGIVERHPHHSDANRTTYLISDIRCYPQIVTGATVNTDEEHYNEWITQLDTPTANALKMQGHSHVNMGVTPSGVDDSYYKEMLMQIRTFYIFMIMNKRQEVYIRFYDRTNNTMFEMDAFDDIVTTQGESIASFAKESEVFLSKPAITVYTAPKSNTYDPLLGKGASNEPLYTSPGYANAFDEIAESNIFIDITEYTKSIPGSTRTVAHGNTDAGTLARATAALTRQFELSAIEEKTLGAALKKTGFAFIAPHTNAKAKSKHLVYRGAVEIPMKSRNNYHKVVMQKF